MKPATLERVPPNDQIAERAVLGSMLLDRAVASMCLEVVGPDDFYHPANGMVVRAIVDLLNSEVPIDFITVRDRLLQSGDLESVGGETYLATLAESVPSSAHGEHYARIVRNKAIRRGFIHTAGGLINAAYSEDQTTDEFIEQAESQLMAALESRRSSEPVEMKDVLKVLFDSIEAGTVLGDGLSTGYFELDNYVKLGKGNLVILAARPGIGKSAAVLGTVLHNAIREKKRVALFSLEMKSMELSARMLSQESGVPFEIITKGKMMTSDQKDRILSATTRMRETSVKIDHELEHGVQSIRSRCRRMAAQGGLDLVVIDYLQLIQSGRKVESRRVEVDEISRGLKLMANELDVPVVALSQMSRDIEKGEREPRLSDLRESGGLEQDADVVIFLHRPHKDEAEKGGLATEDAYLLIRKNRNGQCGRVKMQWNGACMRLEVPYGGGLL